ncbi:cobalamin biosynthesis protein CobW [Bradyrhizobium macuxiense]|uniref:Cobalamin biosynthesis protein CobW n=1 Tax=Bradyrhizobium macuxiense TaxID=1755647 RepID=A0A120FQJ8_9BRAD|nr:GTP-binding protein [Bradyrhizobium macuxiense]KWV58672.1 cobalamin biosynthesis protein CobW [Bradyrhizobium macuxiense]
MSGDGLDFFVLTGFLGSGKTTLLRDFLGRPEAADTAVIVNEAGEIGLDGIVLRESNDELPIATLANGCVCCQIGSDLAFTIDRLITTPRPADARPLRRIILETSGISMPGPVLRTLATLAEHRMRVAVIGTFDLTRGGDVATYEEAVAQWAAAHRIVATKTDLVAPADLTNATSAIAAFNPVAEVVATADRTSAVKAAFAPLTTLPRLDIAAVSGNAHPRVALCLARPAREIAYPDLAAWLDNLAGALGERLLRIKGLVQVVESPRPLLIECVGTMFSPPRTLQVESAPLSGLVIIARDVDEVELGQVAPLGLFDLSSWKAPDRNGTSARRALKAEWVA